MSADLSVLVCVCVCVCVVMHMCHLWDHGILCTVKNYDVDFFSPIMFVVLYIVHVKQITLFHCKVN